MEKRVNGQIEHRGNTMTQPRKQYLNRAAVQILTGAIQNAYNNGTLQSDEAMAQAIHVPGVHLTPQHVFRVRVQKLRILQQRGSNGEHKGYHQKYARKPKKSAVIKSSGFSGIKQQAQPSNSSAPVSLLQIASLLAQASKGLSEFVDQQKAHYQV